jgi:hypothetical protein
VLGIDERCQACAITRELRLAWASWRTAGYIRIRPGQASSEQQGDRLVVRSATPLATRRLDAARSRKQRSAPTPSWPRATRRTGPSHHRPGPAPAPERKRTPSSLEPSPTTVTVRWPRAEPRFSMWRLRDAQNQQSEQAGQGVVDRPRPRRPGPGRHPAPCGRVRAWSTRCRSWGAGRARRMTRSSSRR